MGRSKSKTRRYSDSSNRRLRSDLSTSYVASPVPYLTPEQVRAVFSSPIPSNHTVRNLFNAYQAPRQLPSPGRAGRTVRNGAGRPPSLSQSLRTQETSRVSSPPRSAEERQTMVCVRRQQRREVLHALQKTGQGGQKSPVYNWESKINCKRRK